MPHLLASDIKSEALIYKNKVVIAEPKLKQNHSATINHYVQAYNKIFKNILGEN